MSERRDLFARLAQRALAKRAVLQPRADPAFAGPSAVESVDDSGRAASPAPTGDPFEVPATPRADVQTSGAVQTSDGNVEEVAIPGEQRSHPTTESAPAAAAIRAAAPPAAASASVATAAAVAATPAELATAAVAAPTAPPTAAPTPAPPPVARRVAIEPRPAPPRPAPATSTVAPTDHPAPPPTIDITIGRIEVRTGPPERARRDRSERGVSRAHEPAGPALSLADYLASRRRGHQ